MCVYVMTYFFDLVAHFDEELLNGGFLGSFTEIRQLHINLRELAEGEHLRNKEQRGFKLD